MGHGPRITLTVVYSTPPPKAGVPPLLLAWPASAKVELLVFKPKPMNAIVFLPAGLMFHFSGAQLCKFHQNLFVFWRDTTI